MDPKRCDNCPNPECHCDPQEGPSEPAGPQAPPTAFEAYCEAHPEALECRIYDL